MIAFSPQELDSRILVIENVTHMAKIIVDMIRTMGFRDVHRVTNVVHAFQFVMTSSPSLIIGEAMIQPQGVTRLCRTLRVATNSPDRRLPIIVTIAEATQPVVAAARDAGCHAIIAKPVSAASLATRIAAIKRNPPPFIATGGYTGPDRRRLAPSRKGPERRSGRLVPPDHGLTTHELLGIDPEVLAGTRPPPAHLVAEDNGRALVTEVPTPASRKLPVRQLQPGMELAEPIKAGETLVIAPRGLVLTKDMVPRLIGLSERSKIPPAATIRT